MLFIIIFGSTVSFPIGSGRNADGNISFRRRRGDTSLKLHFRDTVDNNYTLRARISEQQSQSQYQFHRRLLASREMGVMCCVQGVCVCVCVCVCSEGPP